MGIYLYNPTGQDSFAATGSPDPNSSFPGVGNDADIFTYTVDVGESETVALTGDFGDDLTSDGGSSFALSGPAPAFGSLTANANGTFSYAFDRAMVDANGGNQVVSFQVAGSAEGFPDADTVRVEITCFAKGTRIATPDGDCAVEVLKIGDLVTTEGSHAVPVKWIGRQSLHKVFTPSDRFAPVRVSAGALGDGLPHEDLVLTADYL